MKQRREILNNWRIAIVGGGPGGLFTAWRLREQARSPCAITIFEATPRLGGKVQTRRFAHSGVPYEAGAAELYDYSFLGEDPLKDLVLSLGLSISPMGGSAVLWEGQLLSHLDDVESQLGVAARRDLEEFDRRAVDALGPREFFEADLLQNHALRHWPGPFTQRLDRVSDPAARRYLQTLIHSDLASEPGQTSIPYGLHNYLMNRPEYLRLYSIVGGNERLIDALVDRLDAEIRLSHRVVAISANSGGDYTLELQSDTPSGTVSLISADFDFVIVALPNPVLPSLEFQGEALRQAIGQHQKHHAHPAHYLRITLLFERCFWRSVLRESFCMLDQFEGCCLYDESSRNPGIEEGVLGWLLGGDAARNLCPKTDAELVDLALGTLPPQLMVPARDQFREGRVHRWQSEVSALPGGWDLWSLDRRHQPAPHAAPGLFLVGDYLFDSTLNGVLDSADHVAGWIASVIEDVSPRRAIQPKRLSYPMETQR
jgi:protoporphyrinogen oxidase